METNPSSKLDYMLWDLKIRRAFTLFQLMTILEEARNNLIIIEHDPTLYEDATGMIDLDSQAMEDAGNEAIALLYSPGTDTPLEDLTRNADRVFYLDEGPRASIKIRGVGKGLGMHILIPFYTHMKAG